MYQNIFIRKSLDKVFVRYVYVRMILVIYICTDVFMFMTWLDMFVVGLYV